MRSFIAIALVGLVSVVRSDLPHYVLEKSFDTGLQECAEMYEVSSCDLNQYKADSFPNQPEVRRLVRCTLLVLKAWDDATGVVKTQMPAFFQPSPADTCYENRTQVCLNSVGEGVDASDVDTLAYESFQCYYRSYGDLVQSDQFLPGTLLEVEQIFVATRDFLEVMEETFVEFCKGNILDNDRFPQFLYVLLVRGGFVSVNTGVRFDRMYYQFGNESLLAPETKQCVEKVSAEYCSEDDSTQTYQVFVQCLDSLVPLRKLVQDFSKKQVSDPEVCDCTSPQVQVYNMP